MFSEVHDVTTDKHPLITFLENACKQSIAKEQCQSFLQEVERLSGIPFGDLAVRSPKTIQQKNEILLSAVKLAKKHFKWLLDIMGVANTETKKRKASTPTTKLVKKFKKDNNLEDSILNAEDDDDDDVVEDNDNENAGGNFHVVKLPHGETIKIEVPSDEVDPEVVIDMGEPANGAEWIGKPFETPLGQWHACRNVKVLKFGSKSVLMQNICFKAQKSYSKSGEKTPLFYKTNPNMKDCLDIAATILAHASSMDETTFKKWCQIPEVLRALEEAVEIGKKN